MTANTNHTMQMTNSEKVLAFRRKMGLPLSNTPTLLTPEQSSYFARFIMEELSEYLRACEENSLVDAADALVDLCYVTMGCAHAMGLPFDQLFNVVHEANMNKEPANDYIRSVRGSQYDVVLAFRRKMGLPLSTTPTLLTPEQSSYFARFIMEELSEYLRACEENSLVDAADALVDLCYVTMGCAHAMGLPFDQLFNVVHEANMNKEPANDYIRSVRGSQYDVVKPLGWQAPEAMMLAIIQTEQQKAKP